MNAKSSEIALLISLVSLLLSDHAADNGNRFWDAVWVGHAAYWLVVAARRLE